MEGWKRTYWTVWVANLITAIGMMSFLPFFPAHLEHLGMTDRDAIAAWSGAIYGAAPLTAALMSPIWGALGDRFGRKLMVLRAMLGIALFVGLMAFARSPLELLFLRMAQGVFAGFVPPSMTLVSVAAPPDRQGRVSGSLQTALAGGAIIGPVLGGKVSELFDVRAVFVGVSVLTTVSALLVLVFARESASHRRKGPGETNLRQVLAGTLTDFRAVFGHRDLRMSLIIVFWIQFGIGATNPILELHVRDLVGVAAAVSSTSLLFSAMAAFNLPAMPLWGRYGDRVGHRTALFYCTILSGVALGLHALAPTYAWLLGARVLLGLSMAGIAPCAFGLAAAEIGVERRGSAFGTVFSARTLAIAIAATAGGYLSRYLGIPGLFLIGGLLVLLSATGLRRQPVQAK
jgi:DHA1 family multidrug resistance protein-like MFS transporter